MKYKCENELNTFSLKDFDILDISYENGTFSFLLNGGVAKYDNSCNETLEERYISETHVRIMDAEIKEFFLEGGKYYTADDVLIKEVPDEAVSPEKYKEILKSLKEEGKLFFIGEKSADANADTKTFEISVDKVNDTYWITVSGSKIIIEFDRFMNRVMN